VRFSVVIPSYNRRETLEEVLPSLARQTFPEDQYELLLCDAGSTDGTLELVERLNIPNLRVLPGGDSGRSGARNRGIQAARGEIVLFTDADIIADERLLEEHDQTHHRNPGDAVVGCEIQVKTLGEYRICARNPGRYARHRPGRLTLPWHYFLTGNASVARQVLINVGMFDEGFTGYGHEDLELGYRLRQKGLTIHYNPRAVNYHWHPVPFPEQCRKMELAGRSTVRFYRKHRDLRIPLVMGLNPLSLLWHRLIPAGGWLWRRLTRWAENGSGLAQEIVLQHHYLSGIKQALATAG